MVILEVFFLLIVINFKDAFLQKEQDNFAVYSLNESTNFYIQFIDVFLERLFYDGNHFFNDELREISLKFDITGKTTIEMFFFLS